MFLPISCISPATVPKTILPRRFTSAASVNFGLTISVISLKISPEYIRSGIKYSPSAKRLPTIPIAFRLSSRILSGASPISSLSLAILRASFSCKSDSAFTKSSVIFQLHDNCIYCSYSICLQTYKNITVPKYRPRISPNGSIGLLSRIWSALLCRFRVTNTIRVCFHSVKIAKYRLKKEMGSKTLHARRDYNRTARRQGFEPSVSVIFKAKVSHFC